MFLLYTERIIPTIILFVIANLVLGVLRLILRKRCKIKFFRIGELIMIAAIVISGICGFFGKHVNVSTANTKIYTNRALQKDLEQLKNILFKQNPLYYTDKSALEQDFKIAKETLKENKAGMTEEEFYRLINPIVVKVQCGHTNLSISKALQKNREKNARFLPVAIYAEGNKLIDKETHDKVLKINGYSAEMIIDTMLTNISHDGDNLAGAYYIMNLYFATKYYDLIEQPEDFVIEYQRDDNTTYSKKIKAIKDSSYNINSWDLRMKQYEDIENYTSSFEGDVATLRIRVFMEDDCKFSKFLKDFFYLVRKNQCSKVVIDVRGNFGGDPRMAKELLSYLITKPYTYFNSKVSFVEKLAGFDKKVKPKENDIPFESELIIDNACFSTCGHFASIYQSLGLGKIKGEQTAGGSVCTDGSKNVVLHETGIRLHYSTKVFRVNADCNETNVVYPDEQIR